ncbi:MAG: cupredoxin domain-containing protein [Candidatus Bathyarchaeota archaeon]|nr:MAG: cupredoxin domain-containing protein [Candidatus Bathyarchaeota archaeon]
MTKTTRLGVIVVLIAIAAGGFLFISGNLNPSETPVPTGQVQEFEMTAKQFEFNPRRIEVNVGDTVILRITGLDRGDEGHGFAIIEYGIFRVIPDGVTVPIHFVASKSGAFTFFCSVQCGVGHSSMRGTLIVN